MEKLRGFFAKRVQNNSDPASVLEAGWSAMQQMDPRLAEAIQKMPPQVAQQAVLQYTNAIRMGKEGDASKMATDQVRASLAQFAKSPPPPQQNPGIGGLRGAKPVSYEIADVDAFDNAIKPQQEGAGGMFSARKAQMFNAAAPAANQGNAFQQVKDSYNNYNYANREVVMPDDALRQKDLSVPSDWTPRPRPVAGPSESIPNSNFTGWM
jgi:hypothetical protein